MQHGQKPKPVSRPRYGITSRTNVPFDEPLTPGLRKRPPTNAIGFTARNDFAEQSEWMKGVMKRD